MRTVIKYDVLFCIKSKRLWLVIVMCLLLGWVQLIQNISKDSLILNSGAYNIFLFSFFFDCPIINFIAPIIAAVPFSTRLLDEMENGFIKNYCFKIGYRKYIATRFISASINGASVFLFIHIIQFGTALLISAQPSFRLLYMTSEVPFADIYYSSFFLYSIVVIINSMLFGALYSILSMGVFSITHNYYVGYLFPVLFYNAGSLMYGNSNIPFFPFCTFQFYLSTSQMLFKDHAVVLLLGVFITLCGLKMWRRGLS